MSNISSKASSAKKKLSNLLRDNPNVTGVGIGYRSINGRETDEICLNVLVKRKLPDSKLFPNDRFPNEVDGYGVDVTEEIFRNMV